MATIEFTPEQRAEIAARYERGESMDRIAPDFFCNPGVIRRVLREEGVEIRGRGGAVTSPAVPAEVMEHIDWLYHGLGCTLTEIGEELGLHRTTIGKRFARFGIQTRAPREVLRRGAGDATREERRRRGREGWAKRSPEQQRAARDLLKRYSQARHARAD